MGKGGTRFVSDAVGVRQGRTPSTYTNKDLKKNMDKFLATGVHPDFERAGRTAVADPLLPQLPEHDAQRPFVFLELQRDGRPLGRLVAELFEDYVPAAAAHFRNRCLPGGTVALQGTAVHKLVPHHALWGGRRPDAEPARFPRSSRLRPVEAGCVCVALDGRDYAITLDKALPLDATHQVVGRVHKGLEVLQALNDLPTRPDDSPVSRVIVSRSGTTNARGDCDALDGGLPPETRAEAAERLRQESADTRSSVLEALQVGMKRKADGAGPSGSGAAAAAADRAAGAGTSAAGAAAGAAAAPAPAAPPARQVRSKMMDDLLGGLSDGDEDSSDESGG